MKRGISYSFSALLLLSFLVVSKVHSPLTVTPEKTYNDSIVPGGFNPEKHVLLFLEMPKKNSRERSDKITNKLDEAVKKNWPYHYEIVSSDDLNGNTKYSDFEIYRYAILHNLSRRSVSDHSGDVDKPLANVTSIDFCFYDRVTKEKYDYSGKHSSFIGMTIKAFMTMIKKDKNIPLK